MSSNKKLERDILVYLEDYSNTTFREYTLADIRDALAVLLREGLIKDSHFTMETADRNQRELLVLRYMLTIGGHDLVEQLRSGV